MGLNTLNSNYSDGDEIEASHSRQLIQALNGVFAPRNNQGIVSGGQDLGALSAFWENLYIRRIITENGAIDFSQLQAIASGIISGPQRALSTFPDFARFEGRIATIDGSATSVVVSINGQVRTITNEISSTQLSLGSTNDTVQVNSTRYNGSDPYAGEDSSEIPLDNFGGLSAQKIGQATGYRTPQGTIGFGHLTSNSLIDCNNAYFFNGSGLPIYRGGSNTGDDLSQGISNNDNILLLSTGWIFYDIGGVLDITYRQPIYSFSQPNNPQEGDYWFNLGTKRWNRRDAAQFTVVDRNPMAIAVSDETGIVGIRPFDFVRTYLGENNLQLELDGTDAVQTTKPCGVVSIAGETITDLSRQRIVQGANNAPNVTITQGSVYEVYRASNGRFFLDPTKALNIPEKSGRYHPFHNWRSLGLVSTASDSTDFDLVFSSFGFQEKFQGFSGEFTSANSAHISGNRAASTRETTYAPSDSRDTLFLDILSDGHTPLLVSIQPKRISSLTSSEDDIGSIAIQATGLIYYFGIIFDRNGENTEESREIIYRSTCFSGSNEFLQQFSVKRIFPLGKHRIAFQFLDRSTSTATIRSPEISVSKQ